LSYEISSNVDKNYTNEDTSSFHIFPVNNFDVLARAFSSSFQFNINLYNIFGEVYSMYLDTTSRIGAPSEHHWKNLSEVDKTLIAKSGQIFDARLREDQFLRNLSDTLTSSSELIKIMGLGKLYQYFSNMFSTWNNNYVEPIRDIFYRTPSQKICELEKYSLFRYNKLSSDSEKKNVQIHRIDNEEKNMPSPVLVIYAFINRHYILDLLPEISVVRNLLNQGLDIFATDWGTPSVYDRTLTVGHFVNKYIDSSVDIIRRITKSDKVCLLGYCWGGDLALMYSALHPEKVKNLITIATPGDFALDNSLLSIWTRSINEKRILDTFGNVPGSLLNSAFNLRRPREYSHKYFHFFEQPRSIESITEFFATETWLYDSPPVIGEIYREFVEYCYKQNLLIKNKMSIESQNNNDGEVVVNLKNITMPFLNIVAKHDDLVEPDSSKALNYVLTESRDKDLFEFKSGHVGLMIGKKAHQELWPKVANWIKNHS